MAANIKTSIQSIVLAVLAATVAVGPAAADDEGAYGYLRVVDGSAIVRGLDETYDAEVNRPILTGDVLQTRFGSRLEAILPEGTRLRIGSDAEVHLDQMAYSGDQWADTTLLLLQHGEIVLTVPYERPVDAATRVDTPNASVYLDEPGTYSLSSRGYVTQVVVREGRAEALTRQGEHPLRAGDHAWIEGSEWPQVEIRRAGSRSELERWAYDLDLEAERELARSGSYVDGSLGYSTAGLSRYGTWHRYDDGYYWQPTRVAASWRPYDDGYWVTTPSGLTWVSYEPWGWATYHYGTWDYVPAYGWVWYPGRRYAPAWVYWYWGPRYVGWCPTGYYTSFYYGHSGSWGWRGGIYGWGGGRTRNWEHWNFVDHDFVGDRRLARHTRPGAQLEAIQDYLDRGIITSDTSVLGRDALRQPRTAVRVLEDAKRTRAGGDLPDLTDWVARKKDISSDLKRVAMPVRDDRGDSAPRIGATPRRPDTGSDRGAAVRARVPEGVRPPTARAPETPSDRGVVRARPEAPRRVEPPKSDRGDASPRVIRVRPTTPDRTATPDRPDDTAPRADAVKDWRRRDATPATRVERAPDPRSPSPVRRVLEGVRSERPTTAPPAAGTDSGRPDRATVRRPVPTQPSSGSRSSGSTSSGSSSSGSSRPSVRSRSTSSRSSSSSSARSSSRPDRSSSSSSVRQRSSSSSRSSASRRSGGSSSRASSRSKASRSRRSGDPDR